MDDDGKAASPGLTDERLGDDLRLRVSEVDGAERGQTVVRLVHLPRTGCRVADRQAGDEVERDGSEAREPNQLPGAANIRRPERFVGIDPIHLGPGVTDRVHLAGERREAAFGQPQAGSFRSAVDGDDCAEAFASPASSRRATSRRDRRRERAVHLRAERTSSATIDAPRNPVAR